jgi:hypothetical protein
MKKSILIAALVVAAGLFTARPSSAQLSASGDLGTLNSSNQTEGTFHVLAQQISAGSDQWFITVNWVSDGSAAPPTGAFLDQIQVVMSAGGTVSAGQISAGENDQTIDSISGGVSLLALPHTTTAWDTEINNFGGLADYVDPGKAGHHNATNPVNDLELFSGTLTLDAGSSPITAVQFTISNTGAGEEWFGTSVTPEGSSLALLLPGLIPLGLVLRRRRKA